jgi:hypothetical protein
VLLSKIIKDILGECSNKLIEGLGSRFGSSHLGDEATEAIDVDETDDFGRKFRDGIRKFLDGLGGILLLALGVGRNALDLLTEGRVLLLEDNSIVLGSSGVNDGLQHDSFGVVFGDLGKAQRDGNTSCEFLDIKGIDLVERSSNNWLGVHKTALLKIATGLVVSKKASLGEQLDIKCEEVNVGRILNTTLDGQLDVGVWLDIWVRIHAWKIYS